MTDTPKAKIFINKLEAARRQLDAAIRMTFNDEDELAIHTVAAAAYRILRDLLHKRGRSDLKELFAAGAYRMAHSLATGKLSKDKIDAIVSQHPELYVILSNIAEEIKSRGDHFTPDHIKLNGTMADQWNRLSVTANFLKHADRDSGSLISLDDVNNDEIIMHACAAYCMAIGQTPDNLLQTSEMSAFQIWWLAQHDIDQLALEYGDKLAKEMQGLTPKRRRRACLRLVKVFAKWRADESRAS